MLDETARSLKTADMSVPSTASGSSTAQFLRSPSSTEPACPWWWEQPAGVARGHYGIEDVQQVHKHMIAELERHGAQVDMWLYCPYHPDGNVEAFARALIASRARNGLGGGTGVDLDLRPSWVVGDSTVDIGLARAIGARLLHVGGDPLAEPDVTSFPDLPPPSSSSCMTTAERTDPQSRRFHATQFFDAGAFGRAMPQNSPARSTQSTHPGLLRLPTS